MTLTAPPPRVREAATPRIRSVRPDPYEIRPPRAPLPRRPRRRRRIRLADPQRRLAVALGVVLLLLGVIGGRLVQLQGLDGSRYADEATALRLTTIDLQAARGQILDRNGNPLAYSIQAQSIFADPSMITAPGRTALALSPLLGIDPDVLQDKMTGTGRFVYLARGLDPTLAAQVLDLELPGIGALDEQRREYPAGPTAGQVVGFVNGANVGQAGIESVFDSVLTGTPGQLVYERGAAGLPIPAATDSSQAAVPGSSVRLTLDQDLQYQVQQALTLANQDPSVSTVQAVVLDVRTGQVVAMAGDPGYDPGRINETDGDLIANPTVSDVIEPGSVNKIVAFSAALDEGLITLDTPMSVPGSIPIGGYTVNDAWGHGTTNWTALGVLAESSNVGTIMVEQQLGRDRFEEQLHRFGLGEQTGIELSAESPGILAPAADWSQIQEATIAFGQGISMTVLQMASMYQTVANGGVRIPPRIVDGTIAPDGTFTAAARPDPVEVMSAEAAADLTYMLEAVTSDEGTGRLIDVPGYRVAGKTGTAQRPNPDCGCYDGGGYWATFAGFAPVDDPRYVIAISVEQPTGNQHGGTIAAPIFNSVMSYVLAENGVTPSGTPAPEFRFTTDGS